jgi:hypothetical protein
MNDSHQIQPYVIRPGKPNIQVIYQLKATFADADLNSESWDKATKLILEWASEKFSGSIPKTFEVGQSFVDDSIPGELFECANLKDKGVWAMTLEQPDTPLGTAAGVPGRIWKTEVCLRKTDILEFGIRVQCASREFSHEPISYTRPLIVPMLAKEIGLEKIRPINDSVWLIENINDLHNLHELLKDPTRLLPVIVVTEHSVNETGDERSKLLALASEYSKRGLGYAYVVAMPTEFTYAWTEEVGREWTVYNGAVRTYYPRLNFDNDSPYFHPFVTRNHIQAKSDDSDNPERPFIKYLINKIAIRATKERIDWTGLMFFAAADAMVKQIAREQAEVQLTELAEKSKESAELLLEIRRMRETHEQQLKTEQRLREEAESDAERFNDDAIRSDYEKKEIEDDNSQLRTRLHVLTQLLEAKTEEPVDTSIEYPEDYSQLADWIDLHLAGRLKLLPRAKNALKNAMYEKLDLVCDCLLLLANGYRKMKLGELQADQFKRRVDELNIEDCPSANEILIGVHKDSYVVDYAGRRCVLDKHIRKGTSHEERYILRIYYFWDDETSQVVVGWLTGHLPTRSS